MRIVLLIFMISLGLFACKRKGEPEPRICTQAKESLNDDVTIKITDTLTLINCSKRYTYQRWEMPDGATSTKETVYFVPDGIGLFVVKLFVSDDDFVNEYQAVKNVTVIP
jgi:hypothetical protein